MINRLLFLVFAVFAAGCAERIHDVEGTVTLDGKPIDSGYIIFLGNGGKGAEGGARIVDGNYSGKAASGNNLVKVQGFAKLKKPIPDPTLEGAVTDKKKITSDDRHWDNPDMIFDMTPKQVNIDLK